MIKRTGREVRLPDRCAVLFRVSVKRSGKEIVPDREKSERNSVTPESKAIKWQVPAESGSLEPHPKDVLG